MASGDDETIQIYDIKEGKLTKTVPSKKYGVHLARFTHHSRQILHASTKLDGKRALRDIPLPLFFILISDRFSTSSGSPW